MLLRDDLQCHIFSNSNYTSNEILNETDLVLISLLCQSRVCTWALPRKCTALHFPPVRPIYRRLPSLYRHILGMQINKTLTSQTHVVWTPRKRRGHRFRCASYLFHQLPPLARSHLISFTSSLFHSISFTGQFFCELIPSYFSFAVHHKFAVDFEWLICFSL